MSLSSVFWRHSATLSIALIRTCSPAPADSPLAESFMVEVPQLETDLPQLRHRRATTGMT